MSINNFVYLLVFTFLFLKIDLVAQVNSDQHSIFLLSNLEKLTADAPEFDAIETLLKKEGGTFTILIAGDFVDKNGFELEPNLIETNKLDRLIELVKINEKGNIIFLPGDLEWNHEQRKGWKKVVALEEYLESKLGKGNAVFPQKACLGPDVLDIGDHLRIVSINSQWFVQKDNRPEEEDANCKILNVTEFWDEVDDVLTDVDNRNLIIAIHHPILSYGQYAGYKSGLQHLSPPIIGSFLAAYHQNIGNSKDLNNKELRQFSNELLNKSKKHPGVIFVSGHERDIQVLMDDGNYHINSGALVKSRPVARGEATIYKQKKTGFAKLIFQKNGEVSVETFAISQRKNISKTFDQILFSSPCNPEREDVLVNNLYNPCDQEINTAANLNPKKHGTAIAGAQYKAGKFKQAILGKHYRSTWITPVKNIPYLDLENDFGGLRPYAEGGAAQTISLKFKSADGRKFSFRSIDKNPTKRMDKSLAKGIYGKFSQDLTSHQHPYGSSVVAVLLDALDLPHSMPKLYLMPDSPLLGPFRKDFAGRYGTLELKPKGKKKKKKGFRGADDVVSSFQMYQKLLDDHDNKLNVEKYIRARIFDMLISDWDRHENNWKWLAYKNKDSDGITYEPFPKDRDKAFSVLNGVYRLNEFDFIKKDKANFRAKISGLKSLNFKNKSMDRWLTNSYTHDEWIAEAKNIQRLITDEVIDDAVARLPLEVHKLTAPRIKRVLQSRRAQLVDAIEEYYQMVAEYVDLVGSNKREFFKITRLQNGDVQVEMYDLNKDQTLGKLLFDRTYKKSETKEIRLHGLGKPDKFEISGEADKSILIRIVSGDGVDLIEDNSKVSGLKKMTRIYDNRKKDNLKLNGEGKVMPTNEIITFKTKEVFSYNYFKLLPSFSFNTDDGFGLRLSGNYITQGFNKPDFKSKLSFFGGITTTGNTNVGTDIILRHVIKRWDFTAGIEFASRDRLFRQFYGLGNDIDFDDDLQDLDFYQNNTAALKTHLGFRRIFLQKSTFSPSLIFERRELNPSPENDLGTSIYDGLTLEDGVGTSNLLGSKIELDLDFRDDPIFPQRGMQLKISNSTFFNQDLDWKMGGRIKTEVSTFITKGIKIPTTLSVRGGLNHAYGTTPFFYKSFLGQQENLRGFVRNRFGGNTAAFINTDLRFHFGKVTTPLVPIKYGVFGLFDAGKVWASGEDSDTIHTAIGAGIYLIPYIDDLNLTFTFAKADDRELLFSFRVGFFVR
ncbi:MAG: BamA/TamA family outer membrane protein [Saprospiraceae bacterium]